MRSSRITHSVRCAHWLGFVIGHGAGRNLANRKLKMYVSFSQSLVRSVLNAFEKKYMSHMLIRHEQFLQKVKVIVILFLYRINKLKTLRS